MSQNMAQENSSCLVIDLGDQPVRVAPDVENSELSHSLRRGENLPHLHQVRPLGFLRHPIPHIQRITEVPVLLCRFKQFPASDDVQSQPLPYYIRKTRMRQEEFRGLRTALRPRFLDSTSGKAYDLCQRREGVASWSAKRWRITVSSRSWAPAAWAWFTKPRTPSCAALLPLSSSLKLWPRIVRLWNVSSAKRKPLPLDKAERRSALQDTPLGVAWSVASPDGRYLATMGIVQNSNVWMLEGL